MGAHALVMVIVVGGEGDTKSVEVEQPAGRVECARHAQLPGR